MFVCASICVRGASAYILWKKNKVLCACGVAVGGGGCQWLVCWFLNWPNHCLHVCIGAVNDREWRGLLIVCVCVCVYMALSSFWSLCRLCCSVYVPGSGCLSSPPFLLFVFWGFSTVFGRTACFKFAPSASCILSLLMISSQSYIVTPTCLINTHILLKLQSISLLHRLR